MSIRQLKRPLNVVFRSLRRFSSTTTDSPPADEVVFDTTRPNGVALIGLNRPEAKNAMSINLLKCLEDIVDELMVSKTVRCAVLHSLVPRIFCAGADLKERRGMSESDVGTFVAGARKLVQELHTLPMPVIAALDGHALGGGLEFALACDLRVAADNVKMGLVETRLAIIPGAGGTQRLPRLIGASRAKELIYTAKTLNSTEALAIGLVNDSVPQNDEGNAAFLKAVAVADVIASNGPVAVRMAKAAINKGIERDLDAGLEIEELCYAQVIPTKDRIEGLTAFKEKRKPEYKGE